mgnify:CR=1 FL=1
MLGSGLGFGLELGLWLGLAPAAPAGSHSECSHSKYSHSKYAIVNSQQRLQAVRQRHRRRVPPAVLPAKLGVGAVEGEADEGLEELVELDREIAWLGVRG